MPGQLWHSKGGENDSGTSLGNDPVSVMGGANSTDCLPLRTLVQIQLTQNASLLEDVTAQYQKTTQPWP